MHHYLPSLSSSKPSPAPLLYYPLPSLSILTFMVFTLTPNILLTSEYWELRISDQKENIIFDLLCLGVNPLNMIFFLVLSIYLKIVWFYFYYKLSWNVYKYHFFIIYEGVEEDLDFWHYYEFPVLLIQWQWRWLSVYGARIPVRWAYVMESYNWVIWWINFHIFVAPTH